MTLGDWPRQQMEGPQVQVIPLTLMPTHPSRCQRESVVAETIAALAEKAQQVEATLHLILALGSPDWCVSRVPPLVL